jgi:hypothetical protein
MLSKNKLLAQALIVREQAEVFCVDTITLLRRNGETIVNGESVLLYEAPQEIPARIINRSGASRTNIAAQFRATRQTFYDATFRIQLLYGTRIKITDHLLYTNSETGEQQRFEVTYVPPQHEFMGAFVVGAEEVQ